MLFFGRFKNIIRSFGWWFVSILLTAAPLMILDILYPGYLKHFESIISQHSVIFTCFRLASIGLFFFSWPLLVQRFAHQKNWSSAKTHFWIQQRFKLLIWLALFELLVNQNVLFQIFYWGAKL